MEEGKSSTIGGKVKWNLTENKCPAIPRTVRGSGVLYAELTTLKPIFASV
jgi:hypothetical protein